MPTRPYQHSAEKKPAVDVFVRACNRANDCLAKTECETFFNMIPIKLSGLALSLVEATSPLNLDSLVKELQRPFLKTEDLNDLGNTIEMMPQEYSETVVEYAARLRKKKNYR